MASITHNQPSKLDRYASWLVAITLILVPFHAFLTVWASTKIGHFVLLRLWDEAALGLLMVYGVIRLCRDEPLRQRLLTSTLTRVVGLYALLNVALGLVSVAKHEVVLKALGYALIINMRFLFWMLGVWVTAQRSDWLLRHWKRLVFAPLALVITFGLLQFYVLPGDFLRHFGYNKSVSYVADVTLNQDSSTMRVQSFLRGSNPLGAYLAAVLPVVLLSVRRFRSSWQYWLLIIGTAAVLFLTFSRSAWLGVFVALLALGFYLFRSRRRQYLYAVIGGLLIAGAALAVLHGNGSVQNALLHANNHSTARATSNQGHEGALRNSLHDLTAQPFGDGPGTAGQASVYNSGHAGRNTESYWLQIGLELGWPGVLLFGAILLLVGHALWVRRKVSLSLGLFVSLLGLVIVNFFAYGWTDDTLAFVWWGMVGIALAA